MTRAIIHVARDARKTGDGIFVKTLHENENLRFDKRFFTSCRKMIRIESKICNQLNSSINE